MSLKDNWVDRQNGVDNVDAEDINNVAHAVIEIEKRLDDGGTGGSGTTFYPSVSPSGIISWTNDGGLPNPTPINIKGSRGEKGDKGDKGDPTDVQQTTGQSTTAVMSQKATTDKINALKSDLLSVSLGVHTDGLIYIFVNGEPVGTGIEQVLSGDVIGYVDSENNIVLTGELADGTYTLKYEMEDGTVINIGDLVKGTTAVNQFIMSTDYINKYVSTSNGAFSTRNGAFCVEVDGINLADNNPYIVRISGVTPVKDSGDGSYGRIALLDSNGTLITVQHITDAKITQDVDSWYFNIHDFSSDTNAYKCRFNIWLRTDRSEIALSDVENLFVEFEPLNV